MVSKKKKVDDGPTDMQDPVPEPEVPLPPMKTVSPALGDVQCYENIRSLMKGVSRENKVPSFVEFGRASGKRGYVILDVPSNIVRAGFEVYRVQHPDAPSEEYIAALERIAMTELPRLFKTVDKVVL